MISKTVNYDTVSAILAYWRPTAKDQTASRWLEVSIRRAWAALLCIKFIFLFPPTNNRRHNAAKQEAPYEARWFRSWRLACQPITTSSSNPDENGRDLLRYGCTFATTATGKEHWSRGKQPLWTTVPTKDNIPHPPLEAICGTARNAVDSDK